MINLTQDQFKWAAQITNVLEQFQSFFRRSPQHDYIVAVANRLAVWGFRGAQVDEAMRTLLDRDDEKFPTANQIRDIATANRKASANESVRDPQIDKDREKYERHRAQFEAALGKELLQKYIDFWHKEFFKSCDGFADFLTPRRAFDQLAIADLARGNGNPKRAIMLVRAEVSKLPDHSIGDIYESEKIIFHRGKSAAKCSFTIKEAN